MARLKGDATVRVCVYDSWTAQASGKPGGFVDKCGLEFSDNGNYLYNKYEKNELSPHPRLPKV